MFVDDKFLIGGIIADEKTNENIGILNICKADDEIYFSKSTF